MVTDTFNPKKALQLTRIIYFTLIAAVLVYLGIVYFISTESYIFSADFSDPLIIALVFLSITAIPVLNFYSTLVLKKIDPGDPLSKKFPVYQNGLIIRIASCEGIALFAVVCLLLTNNSFCLIFFFAALAIMILYYPTPEKIGKEIKLSPSEIALF